MRNARDAQARHAREIGQHRPEHEGSLAAHLRGETGVSEEVHSSELRRFAGCEPQARGVT